MPYRISRTKAGLLLLLALGLVAGCVRNAPFRTLAGPCQTPGCTNASIEVTAVPGKPGAEYLLGAVEFDDQGLVLDRRQMEALFDRLAAESRTQDLCMVVFVHGWKHNADPSDDDVKSFRKLLAGLAVAEQGRQPHRKVFGIYAGWRGQVIDGPDLLADLSFWDRKAAAGRVAQGSIRELLARARAMRDRIDHTSWSGASVPLDAPLPPGKDWRSTRLLTIGHSFGGLIVFDALAQAMTDRASQSLEAGRLGSTAESDKAIASYGDLVVIVNPAVEATAFEPLHQLMQGRDARTLARNQNPVLIQVTSSADQATGTAFPLGRWFNVITESFVDRNERSEASKAIGHWAPFWTHDLTRDPEAPAADAYVAKVQAARPEDLSAQECAQRAAFETQWRQDGYLRPGWSRRYSAGALLSHRQQSGLDPNVPFWMVHADKSVIADHGDIQEPVFVDFIRQLYDELLPEAVECGAGGPERGGLAGEVKR
ncbi:MAG: hypothetical protein RQ966_04995 [Acetobacteraceae bacterium]|nr:hypothetical protein [Acetobacteraceae bacterium]